MSWGDAPIPKMTDAALNALQLHRGDHGGIHIGLPLRVDVIDTIDPDDMQ
jgi:hypothetical protein